MTDLRDAFERATDGIESPALVAVALTTARRRRARRRGAAAAAVAVVAVAGVSVVTSRLGSPSTTPPPPGSSSTAPASEAPTEVAQPELDRVSARDMAAAPATVAPLLPRTVRDPYGSATGPEDLAASPVEAAVLAMPVEFGAVLLGTDGRWRRVGEVDRYNPVLGVDLSPRGTRLVTWDSENTVTVHDLATGGSQELPHPQDDGVDSTDPPAFRFTDEDTLVTVGSGPSFEVDAATGAAEPASVEVDGLVAFDEDGVPVVGIDGNRVLVDHVGGVRREGSTDRTGAPTELAVTGALVAGSVDEGSTMSFFLADRETLAPLATLAVTDVDRLDDYIRPSIIGLTADGTVLIGAPASATIDFDGFRVVAWDPDAGTLREVSRVMAGDAGAVEYADGLLRDTADADPSPPVQPTSRGLAAPLDLPQERSLNIPADLTVDPDPDGDRGGGVVMALQTPDGQVVLVRADDVHVEDDLPTGTLFRHSLAIDGGALALRTGTGFAIHSIYADRTYDYDVERTGDSGLWLGDSVGFLYDVPGPGGESREHEPPFSVGPTGFPAGDDLDAMDLHPAGGADELVDGTYMRWASYGDELLRVDLGALGDLRGPASGAERWAVVRSGAGSGQDGVLVLDHAGDVQTELPLDGIDPDDVVLHHWVDDDRLLLQAADRLVLWDVVTQRLTQVSVLPPGAVVSVSDGDGSLVRR